MATRTIVVCDTCEDVRRPVKTFEVKDDQGGKAKVTLCPQHSRPLEVLLGNAKPTGRPPAKKAVSRVTTVDEIEKKKATRKRA